MRASEGFRSASIRLFTRSGRSDDTELIFTSVGGPPTLAVQLTWGCSLVVLDELIGRGKMFTCVRFDSESGSGRLSPLRVE